jgi:hypothetical protein
MQSNICRVCKRKLKNIDSIRYGIGPICRAKRLLGEDDKQGELFMVEAIEGFNEDVVCFRVEQTQRSLNNYFRKIYGEGAKYEKN